MIKNSKNSNAIITAYNLGYRVDNDGHVFSPTGRELKLTKSGTKGMYLHFSIIIASGERYTINVHQLAAYQKFGNKLFESETVRHLNGDSTDNSYSNIEVGTQKDNMQDMSKEDRLANAIHASSFVKIHNHEQIIKDHNNGMSYSEIMKKYNIKSKGTISFIIRNSISSKNI